MQNQDQHIILDKELRRDIDAIIQRLKTSGITGDASPSAYRQSRERSLAITKLQEAVMWLGMDLKAINDENPQPQTGWKPSDALERAWGIIANASGGDWQKESPEWQDAAARFRDEVYHPSLTANPYPNSKDPSNSKIDPTADGLKL